MLRVARDFNHCGYFFERVSRAAYNTILPATANDFTSNPSRRKNSCPKNRKRIIRAPDASVALAGDRLRFDALGNAARSYAVASDAARPQLMPLIIDAVRVRASVGEISDVLRDVWGAYRAGA